MVLSSDPELVTEEESIVVDVVQDALSVRGTESIDFALEACKSLDDSWWSFTLAAVNSTASTFLFQGSHSSDETLYLGDHHIDGVFLLAYHDGQVGNIHL